LLPVPVVPFFKWLFTPPFLIAPALYVRCAVHAQRCYRRLLLPRSCGLRYLPSRFTHALFCLLTYRLHRRLATTLLQYTHTCVRLHAFGFIPYPDWFLPDCQLCYCRRVLLHYYYTLAFLRGLPVRYAVGLPDTPWCWIRLDWCRLVAAFATPLCRTHYNVLPYTTLPCFSSSYRLFAVTQRLPLSCALDCDFGCLCLITHYCPALLLRFYVTFLALHRTVAVAFIPACHPFACRSDYLIAFPRVLPLSLPLPDCWFCVIRYRLPYLRRTILQRQRFYVSALFPLR